MNDIILFLIYILVAIVIPIIEIKVSLMENFRYGLIIPIVTFLIILFKTGVINYFLLLFNETTYPPQLFKACIALFYLAIYGCCRLAVYYRKRRHKKESI